MSYVKEKKIEIALYVTIFFGFIFRVVNAKTRIVLGDPPHLLLHAKNFLNSGLLSVWDQSTFLWYAVTDIFFRIFGTTQFASRFASVLFGTLTILAVYLFVKEFSGNKIIALISAAIYAFAPTFIFNAADEQDISVLFFIVFSFYFLVKGLKKESNKYLIYSSIIFGLAAMWKAYLAVLVIPYFGLIFYYTRTKRFDLHKNYKILIWMVLIIGLMVSPTFVYEYSNYKHNEVTTFMFAKFLISPNQKINELYGWAGGGDLNRRTSNILQRIFISHKYGTPEQESTPSELYYGLTESLYSNGPILIFLSLAGITFMFFKRKKDTFAKDYLVFYLLYFLIPFFILIDSNLLSKHYVHFFAFAIPFISYLVNDFYTYVREKSGFVKRLSEKRNFVYLVLIFVLVFEFFVVLSLPFNGNEFLFSKNRESQILEFKEKNIPKNSLIIYDERIYNSLAGWLFNDRLYISVRILSPFMEYNEKSEYKQLVPVYIVECAPDQCGWATTPSLNDSMESFFGHVKNQSFPIVHVSKSALSSKRDGIKYYNPLISRKVETPDQFIVYKTMMNIDLNLVKQIKSQYHYFLYPINYENKNSELFSNFTYTPTGFMEVLLNKVAWFVFYIEILLSFITIPWILSEYYLNH